MPRTAATMTGLVLAACSIGFNTIRYPIVSEMVGPALASAPSGEPLQTAPAASPAQPESPSPASVPPDSAVGNPPAAQADVQPVPDVAGAIAGPAPPSAEPAGRAAAAGDDAAAASTNPEKPLVPVSPAAVSRLAAAADPGGAVRRLPPVDGSPRAAGRDWQPVGGPIPVYPSTGIK